MAGLLKSMSQLASVSASRLAGRQLVAPARPVAPRYIAAAATTKASMGKKDLVAAVREKSGLTPPQAEAAVNAVLDTIVGTVAKGGKVTIPGFGVFEARHRAARRGRNPQTGEELQIAETVTPAFSAGKGFKDQVKASANTKK